MDPYILPRDISMAMSAASLLLALIAQLVVAFSRKA
jgi:hypothetical protein